MPPIFPRYREDISWPASQNLPSCLIWWQPKASPDHHDHNNTNYSPQHKMSMLSMFAWRAQRRRNWNTKLTPRFLTFNLHWHLYWSSDANLWAVSFVIVRPSFDLSFQYWSRNLLICNLTSLVSPAQPLPHFLWPNRHNLENQQQQHHSS